MDAATTGGIRVGQAPVRAWPLLARHARALAAHLADHHPPGTRVAVPATGADHLWVGVTAAMAAGLWVLPQSANHPAASRAQTRLRHRITLELAPPPTPPGATDAVPPGPKTAAAGRLLLTTSGSTGEPLCAVLSPAALWANATAIAQTLDVDARTVTLAVPPPHHAYGFSILTSHMSHGATVVVEPAAAFPASLLATATATGCTVISAVPTTWNLLMRGGLLEQAPVPTLRQATVAGGALPPGAQAPLRQALHPAGLYVMYGQTEACARLTCLPPRLFDSAPTSCGAPLPNVTLQVAPDGQVLARAPSLMDGYLDEPQRTAAVLANGWLHTGDVGRLDASGLLHLEGRQGHMLKVGGVRVAPGAVEAALCEVAGVQQACVVGAPDSLLGQVPVAFVVGAVEPSSVRAQLARVLSKEEAPRAVVTVPALPLLPGGKPDLRALQARAALAWPPP